MEKFFVNVENENPYEPEQDDDELIESENPDEVDEANAEVGDEDPDHPHKRPRT